jgi:hypothetical protein
LGSGKLYVNRADNRGKAILENNGVMQSQVSALWLSLVKLMSPTIVLDIGANHGEVSLSARYSQKARIMLFEPNPSLTPFLEQSISSHINRSQISLLTRLVSDSISEQPFYVDRKWSGTSSALGPLIEETKSFKGEGPESFEKLLLASVITLKPAIRYQFKTGQLDWPKT